MESRCYFKSALSHAAQTIQTYKAICDISITSLLSTFDKEQGLESINAI